MSSAIPIAQDEIVELLTVQLKCKRLAPSYLITAPPGFGKQQLAWAFARALECEQDRYFEDCNCQSCRKVSGGTHPDVHWYDVEEGAQSVKIQAIKDLNYWIGLRPFEGRRKVFIVSHADKMTEEAANALLKTLEEPPSDSHVILLAQSKARLLDTIVSRCFELRMKPIPSDVLEKILKSEHGVGAQARFLALSSGGSFGEALRLHESGFSQVKNECLDALFKEGPIDFFEGIASLSRQDISQVIDILFVFLRDLLVLSTSKSSDCLINIDRIETLQSWSCRLSKNDIFCMLRYVHEAKEAISGNVNQKLALNRLTLGFLRLPIWSDTKAVKV